MDVLTIVIITLVTSAVAGYAASKIASKVVRKRGEKIIKEAEAEGEMIKKERILQAKEKFIQLKSEHDRAVNERNQKIAQSEQRAKQIESNLLAQQEELSKKTKEVNAAREHLDAQLQGVERRKEELDRKIKEQNVRLEQIGGLSSEEAKNILIENMKAEAKTEAMTYVNEVMEEAKMTAGKEAKKIVVQTIQRVATEAAIENSVTVFNIDSDEVKGRIIGREGRNIRALEAATGIEIIVDDTPEAIILSGFDPVRREIARLALHQLVTDGRIHPARIEEVVAKVQKQIEEEIIEAGKRTTIDLGIHGLHPELIRLIGKQHRAIAFVVSSHPQPCSRKRIKVKPALIVHVQPNVQSKAVPCCRNNLLRRADALRQLCSAKRSQHVLILHIPPDHCTSQSIRL